MGQEHFEAARTLGFEIRNPQRFAHNMARLVEEAGKASAVLLRPHAISPTHFTLHDDLAPALRTLAQLQRAWVQQPHRVLEAQVALWNNCLELWHSSMRRLMGLETGEAKPTGHLASRRSPVSASGLVRKPLLRPAAAIVPDHLALGRIPGQYGRRSRSPHPEQGSVLPDADHQCDCAIELGVHEPGAAPRDLRVRW